MALAGKGGIVVEGIEDLQRAVSRSKNRDLIKNMQAAHKHVGQFVKDRLSPQPVDEAVGAGRGSTVRVSGSRSAVQLMAGGKHRQDNRGPDAPKEQWGVRTVGRVGPRPDRPHIIGTAQRYQTQIEDEFRDAVTAAFAGAFWKAD